MRGHITKRGKDSYTIVIDFGRDAKTGKRQQHWESIKGNKKDAEKRLSELLSQIDNGIFIKPKKTTVADYLETWLSEYVKINLSTRSYERYFGVAKKHLIPDFGSITLTQLKPEHLQKHYASKIKEGLSARSVKYHHAIMHSALQTAVKWGLVARNVAGCGRTTADKT